MLAHTLKSILEFVPDALPLVKQASVDKEMPLDSRDSTIATALQMKYFEKIAYQAVDVFELEKVAEAVKAYGVADEVNRLTEVMVKSAQEAKSYKDRNSVDTYMLKVSSFEGNLNSMSTSDRGEMADSLYKEAQERKLVPSDDVILYSGNGYFSKEAAVKSLSVRYHSTKNENFVKLASAIGKQPTNMDPSVVRTIGETISEMDKEAGLHFRGHNFFRETCFVKEAAFKGTITVKVANKDIPYEHLERVGRGNIASYLGEDIAKEMDAGPMNFKNVVETLPMDMQHVLSSLVKNV